MIRNNTKILADVLYSPFWCRPEFYEDLKELPEKTQAVLWQDEKEICHVLWPVPMKNGETVRVEAADADPYVAVRIAAEKIAEMKKIPLRAERSYPEILEYLGWCTWDAMEIWVNEAGVLQKCAEFSEKKVPIRWAILDDMWAKVWAEKELPMFTPHEELFPIMHASKLADIEADPKRFPDGLKGCIEKIRACGLEVGVWHPVTGYWAGILPGSKADEILGAYCMEGPQGYLLPDLRDEEKTRQFFRIFHEFIKDCGASFVKIDNQSCLETRYEGSVDRVTAAENLQKAIDASTEELFDGALINCMCMASENMFERPLSAVTRCSDDFQPENRSWFAKHIKQCAYNGLFQGQFYVNDWDMFWTDDGQAVKNSVLRALSGGPVYVSDRIGRTRPEILAPLCDEAGRLYRCDFSAIPARDCLFEDPVLSGKAFKVWNTARGLTYIAAFDLQEDGRSAEGKIVPGDFGISGDALLYRHFARSAEKIPAGDAYGFTLESPDEFELFTVIPLEAGITVLGNPEKYIKNLAAERISEDTVRCDYDGKLLYVKDDCLSETDVVKGLNRIF